MYAIRSYYGYIRNLSAGGLMHINHGFKHLGGGYHRNRCSTTNINNALLCNGNFLQTHFHRITSYNVCYTKLLRIAKIERQNALDDIEAISLQAQGVMVARGDLALEMSLQEVPIAQKRIINVCRKAAVPVITATQMLESMIDMHKPTRAEVADVANAILDGTDALMLSAETAIGQYPIETVTIMSVITSYSIHYTKLYETS